MRLQLQLLLQIHLQVQLLCTTLHPAVVGDVTTAASATTPKNTTPTIVRYISEFALQFVIHNNQPLQEIPIFDISGATLRGTTSNCVIVGLEQSLIQVLDVL